MGTYFLAAASTTAKKGGSSELVLLAVIFAVMVVFMFRSSRRRKLQAQQTQQQVMDGARIRTTFGVYGTIVESDQRNVIVEIAPGVRMKMLRQAVATVVPDDEPEGVFQTVPDLDGDTASTGSPDDRSDKN